MSAFSWSGKHNYVFIKYVIYDFIIVINKLMIYFKISQFRFFMLHTNIYRYNPQNQNLFEVFSNFEDMRNLETKKLEKCFSRKSLIYPRSDLGFNHVPVTGCNEESPE